jgi:hypothetical protein
MNLFINRTIDIIIALSLLLGVMVVFSNDDSDEYEAEINPVDAKVQQYCSMAEDSADVPLNVKKACLARKKKFETEQEFEPATNQPELSDQKTLYRI